MLKQRFLWLSISAVLLLFGAYAAFSQVGATLFATRFANIPIHDPESAMYIGTPQGCVACHTDRSNELSLDPSIKRAHSSMIFLASSSQGCKICHVPPDLIYRSAAGLRQQVDRASCATRTCHGVSGPLPFYAINSEETGVGDWRAYDTCPISDSARRR